MRQCLTQFIEQLRIPVPALDIVNCLANRCIENTDNECSLASVSRVLFYFPSHWFTAWWVYDYRNGTELNSIELNFGIVCQIIAVKWRHSLLDCRGGVDGWMDTGWSGIVVCRLPIDENRQWGYAMWWTVEKWKCDCHRAIGQAHTTCVKLLAISLFVTTQSPDTALIDRQACGRC